MTFLQSTVRACKKRMIKTTRTMIPRTWNVTTVCIIVIDPLYSLAKFMYFTHMEFHSICSHNIILYKPHIFTQYPNTVFFCPGQLKSLGMRPTTEDDHPDVVLLNTCSIREKAGKDGLYNSWLLNACKSKGHNVSTTPPEFCWICPYHPCIRKEYLPKFGLLFW